jgi:hypothetical protein
MEVSPRRSWVTFHGLDMTDFARSRTTDQVAVADTHTYNDERER